MHQRAAVLFLSLFLSAAVIPQAQAQLFGPSDEEKQRETDQDVQLGNLTNQNQQLQARIQSLEDQARSLVQTLSQATGNNEELRHQIDLLNQKVDQQQKDFAYRLCMISAQQLGAGADDQGLNCAATGMAMPSAPSQAQAGLPPGAALPPVGANPAPSSGAPIRLAPPPGTLGTLSPSDAGMVAMRPPGGNQFDAAMNLLAKAQYDEAKASFRSYA